MPSTVFAYVGLGSNLGDRKERIARSLREIDALPGTRVLRSAPVRETAPEGVADQPAFLNTVAEIETSLTPQSLMDRLLEIETLLGRVRTLRWGPRSIDLDLLLHGGSIVDGPSLTLPHPRLAGRVFVLEPLAELRPDLGIPGTGATAADLLETLLTGPRR